MTEELKMKLAKLRTLAPKLNEATDEAAAVIATVERLLGQELSLGVTAQQWYGQRTAEGYESDEDDESHRLDEAPTVSMALAYGRVDGRFCIHVVEETTRDGVDDRNFATTFTLSVERTPWISCPRDMKLESFAALPGLLGGLADEVERLTSKAAETSKAARELLDAMGGTATPSQPQAPVQPRPVTVNAATVARSVGQVGAEMAESLRRQTAHLASQVGGAIRRTKK